jgi:hypothetical protein
MPELSIAAYIDNITYFGIISFLAMFVLLIVFLFSKLFRRQARAGSESQVKKRKIRVFMELKKDPNLVRNLLSLSFIFLSLIIFILFILLILPFSNNVILGPNFYLIIGFLFYIVAIAVLIVKSKIFK